MSARNDAEGPYGIARWIWDALSVNPEKKIGLTALDYALPDQLYMAVFEGRILLSELFYVTHIRDGIVFGDSIALVSNDTGRPKDIDDMDETISILTRNDAWTKIYDVEELEESSAHIFGPIRFTGHYPPVATDIDIDELMFSADSAASRQRYIDMVDLYFPPDELTSHADHAELSEIRRRPVTDAIELELGDIIIHQHRGTGWIHLILGVFPAPDSDPDQIPQIYSFARGLENMDVCIASVVRRFEDLGIRTLSHSQLKNMTRPTVESTVIKWGPETTQSIDGFKLIGRLRDLYPPIATDIDVEELMFSTEKPLDQRRLTDMEEAEKLARKVKDAVHVYCPEAKIRIHRYTRSPQIVVGLYVEFPASAEGDEQIRMENDLNDFCTPYTVRNWTEENGIHYLAYDIYEIHDDTRERFNRRSAITQDLDTEELMFSADDFIQGEYIEGSISVGFEYPSIFLDGKDLVEYGGIIQDLNRMAAAHKDIDEYLTGLLKIEPYNQGGRTQWPIVFMDNKFMISTYGHEHMAHVRKPYFLIYVNNVTRMNPKVVMSFVRELKSRADIAGMPVATDIEHDELMF